MLEPVPGDYRPPGLVKEPVYYLETEKKMASKVLEAAKSIVPPQGSGMQHIKRVKPVTGTDKLAVLICQTYRINEGELQSLLSEKLGTDVQILHSEASRYPARTGEEAQEWSKEVWPMMWRGNIKAQPPQISEEDAAFATKVLAEIPDVGDSQCCNTCYIIDPSTKKQIGGYPTNTDISEGLLADPQKPLWHPVMRAIDAVAHHATTDAYLCVGLDVYCSREPCVMCCMALVHSRINRLFFKIPSNSTKGALTHYCLHGRSQLNHTYETWRLDQQH